MLKLVNLSFIVYSMSYLYCVTSNGCPVGCTCDTTFICYRIISPPMMEELQNATSLNIQEAEFSYLPDDMFKNFPLLKYLIIRQTNLKKLTSKMFQHSPFLITIDLTSNKITDIEEDTFHELPNLENLYLQYNKLTSIPATFLANSTKVISLDFDSNRIVSVHENAFSNLTSLQYLYLSSNLIDNIPTRLFHGLTDLRSIWLSNNRLTNINNETFNVFTSLVVISLAYNYIQKIDDFAFYNLNNNSGISKLYLDGNLIQNITENMFYGLKTTTHLSMSFNKISYIAPFSFSNMSSLIYMFLTNNLLNEMNEETFYGLENLLFLRIDENKIEKFNKALHPLIKLQYLYANRNKLTSILKDNFMNNTNLRLIQLNENLISSIEIKTFVAHTLLSNLYLSFNQLEVLKKDMFLGLSSLYLFDVSNNSIHHIEIGTLAPLNNWIHLGYFQHNKLSDIEVFNEINWAVKLYLAFNNFKDFPLFSSDAIYLIELDLSYNLINAIGDTTSLVAITTLDISGNPIKADTYNQLSNIKALKYLKMTNLNLTSLPFNSGSKVETINLSDNNFTHLPDVNLDIFVYITNIDMSGNPLICDCHNYAIANTFNETRFYRLQWYGDCHTSVNETSVKKTMLHNMLTEDLCLNNGTCDDVKLTCHCENEFTGEFCEIPQVLTNKIPFCNGTAICDMCVPININDSMTQDQIGLDSALLDNPLNPTDFDPALLCHCYYGNATICVATINSHKSESKISKYWYLLIIPGVLLIIFVTLIGILIVKKRRTKKDSKKSVSGRENLAFDEAKVKETKPPVYENTTKENSRYESIESPPPVYESLRETLQATKHDIPITTKESTDVTLKKDERDFTGNDSKIVK